MKILIVEDEPGFRECIENQVIKHCKTERSITLVSSGEEAIKCLKEEKYDLIFTDYNMGGLTGLDVAIEARKINPSQEIYLVTGEALTKEFMGRVKPYFSDILDKFNINWCIEPLFK